MKDEWAREKSAPGRVRNSGDRIDVPPKREAKVTLTVSDAAAVLHGLSIEVAAPAPAVPT
jgi:hypothetical protein